MKYLSVCSGIEAATVAWHSFGWEPVGFSEIEPFPSAVLKHHYPDVPNYGDMTALAEKITIGEIDAPDLLCGGTPCQAFSVAGLRQSLDDARGNLTLTFCEIGNAIDNVRCARGDAPAIIFWENVPGVLNTKDNAFGCFLGELAGEDCALEPAGAKWTNAGFVLGPKRAIAWRVLDAQYFGVAQRRRRVFVVASARDDFNPAKVLFEWEGVRRDTAPSREAGQVAPTIPSRSTAGGGLGTDFDLDGGVVPQTFDFQSSSSYGEANVSATLSARDFKSAKDLVAQPIAWTEMRTNKGMGVMQPVAFAQNQLGEVRTSEVLNTLNTNSNASGRNTPMVQQAVAFGADLSQKAEGIGYTQELSPCVTAGTHPGHGNHVQMSMQVRRLTPVECERLQGFPDGYTNIPWRNKPEAPDGPRYKALGNSWAVPVVRWIGKRIDEELKKC